jgi:UDP-glucose 4-epimerase
MKILITGGAGYIGTELVYNLLLQPQVELIIVYDNLSRGNYNFFIGTKKIDKTRLKFIEADILDSRRLKKALQDIDIVYHLAAKVTTPFSDQNPHEFEQINHWGTAELTYALEESKVKKFIYLSSVSVYGSSKEEVDVDSPINPKTFYGISKMRGEEHVNRMFSKLPTYIIRLGNVFGYSKSMRFDAVINRFLFDAHYKKRITINGSGNQFRAFTHIHHACSILTKIGVTQCLQPGRYDLVDANYSVNQIADVLKNLYPDLEILFVNQHMQLRDIKVKPNTIINQIADNRENDLNKLLSDFRSEFITN